MDDFVDRFGHKWIEEIIYVCVCIKRERERVDSPTV
jgi:hypothetical protein